MALTYPERLLLQLPASSTVTNKGQSGQTLADMESDAATDIDPLRLGLFTPTAPPLSVRFTERANNVVLRYPVQLQGIGTSGFAAYYYRYSCVIGGHESWPCFVSRSHVGWSGTWNSTLSSTDKIRVQGHLPAGSTSAKVYGRTPPVSQGLLSTVAASTPAVTSITAIGTEATVTTGVAQTLALNDRVTVSGCTPSAYNMIAVVTSVPTTTTFTYSMMSAPTSPATGTPVVTYFIYTDTGADTPGAAFKTSTVDDPGLVWTATLPAYSGANSWLLGSQVVEWQRTVNVTRSGPVDHLFATATFDVRSFSDGDHRVNVRVQTPRDSTQMNQWTYDVAILVNGSPVTTAYTPKTGFTHYSFTGWQQFVYIGSGREATFLFDFTNFSDAKLLPKMLPGVVDHDYTSDVADTSRFDLGQFGFYNQGVLNSPGANPYLAPLDNWSASWLVHQSAAQRTAMLHCAYNAFASWSTAVITNSVDALYKVTDAVEGELTMWVTAGQSYPAVLKCPIEPNPRGGNYVIKGGANGSVYGYETMEHEHMPPVGWIAYYATGDRCYLDVAKCASNSMVFTNQPGLGNIWPDRYDDGSTIYSGRGAVGGHGAWVTYTNDPRAMARPFRNMVYAATMCPDTDADKSYFIGCVNDTLDWLAYYHTHRATDGTPLRDALSVWWETTQGGGPAAWVYYDNTAPGTTIKWSYGNNSPYGNVEEAWAVYWASLQGIFTVPADSINMAKRLSIYYVVLTTNPSIVDPGAGLGTFVTSPSRRRVPGALPIEYPATLAEFVHWTINHGFMFTSNERRLTCSIDVASKTLTAPAGTFSVGMVGFPICVWGPYGSNWTEQRYRDFGAGPVQIDLGGAYKILQYISETQVVLDHAPASANATGGTVLLGQQFSYPPCIGACDGPEARLGIAMCDYWGVPGASTAKLVAAAYNGGELETTMNTAMPGFAIVVPQ